MSKKRQQQNIPNRDSAPVIKTFVQSKEQVAKSKKKPRPAPELLRNPYPKMEY